MTTDFSKNAVASTVQCDRRMHPIWFEKPMQAVLLTMVGVLICMAATAAPADSRPRVIVSTDVGGTDFDDYQSVVHFLVYADRFDIEGILSSPFDRGNASEILKVINCYERDYPNLKTYSDKYPPPDALRALTKQGETNVTDLRGYSRPTEASEWIGTLGGH